MCMYACMCVCMHACVCVCMHACMCVCSTSPAERIGPVEAQHVHAWHHLPREIGTGGEGPVTRPWRRSFPGSAWLQLGSQRCGCCERCGCEDATVRVGAAPVVMEPAPVIAEALRQWPRCMDRRIAHDDLGDGDTLVARSAACELHVAPLSCGVVDLLWLSRPLEHAFDRVHAAQPGQLARQAVECGVTWLRQV